MFAEPTLTPVTFGWVAGVVWPAKMVTLVGLTVSLEVSELLRVTVTFLPGATGRVTAKFVDCPRPAVTPDGSPTVRRSPPRCLQSYLE